jgi:hypothetical protein
MKLSNRKKALKGKNIRSAMKPQNIKYLYLLTVKIIPRILIPSEL